MRLPDRYTLELFWRDHARRVVSGGLIVAVLAVVLGAGYWWFEVRWQPPPSIFDTPVDNVASYFVSDDFNRLPVEERMELIAQFVSRFRGMSQSESAVLASFMAGVTGKTREQLEENIRLLARDLMKDGAEEYFNTPPEERASYMDAWIIKWMKFGERVERGEERELSDDERLASIRRDSQRDEERMREDMTGRDMTQRDAVRFVDFWRREVETVASPKEQAQIMNFMRDLRKHLGGR